MKMNLANKLTIFRILLVPVIMLIPIIDNLVGIPGEFLGISTAFWIMNIIFIVASITVLAREFIVSGYRLIAVEKGGKVISASIWGKLKTVTQMIGIIFAFLDKFNFGEFIFRVSTQAEAQINSVSIYMTTGQYIINIITTIVLTLSVIATIFSGINYLKDGKDLFKD